MQPSLLRTVSSVVAGEPRLASACLAMDALRPDSLESRRPGPDGTCSSDGGVYHGGSRQTASVDGLHGRRVSCTGLWASMSRPVVQRTVVRYSDRNRDDDGVRVGMSTSALEP